MSWRIVFTRQAAKDAKKLKGAKLDGKAKQLIEKMKEDPFIYPPHYEALVGDLEGLYSRRTNVKHRLVYQVLEEAHTVKIVSLWSHYENV